MRDHSLPSLETPTRSTTRSTTLSMIVLLMLSGLVLVACGPETAAPPPAETPTAEPPAATPTDGASPAATPADGPPPMTSRDDGEAGTEVNAAGLVFEIPADWTPEAPSSSMRAAQAAIPGSAGPGQLTVFHFGPGGGGGVESNLQRWAGQVEQDAGTAPIRDQFENAAGLKVTWIDVQGTLKPSTMGTGPTEAQPGSRLLGAVVEGPGGPWFFKATGPAESLAEGRDAFIAMLQGASL